MPWFVHICSTLLKSCVKRLKSFPHDCSPGVRLSAPKGALLQTINNLQYCKWTSAISPSSFDVGDEWFFCEASVGAAPWGSRTYSMNGLLKDPSVPLHCTESHAGSINLCWGNYHAAGIRNVSFTLPCSVFIQSSSTDSCRWREGFIRFHSRAQN